MLKLNLNMLCRTKPVFKYSTDLLFLIKFTINFGKNNTDITKVNYCLNNFKHLFKTT